MKKITAILLMLATLFTFAACTQKTENTNTASTVTVIISSDEFYLEGPAWLNENYSTAGEAIQNFCQEKKIAYRTTNGLYDGFNGQDSTLTDGWLLYINGTLSNTGADTTSVSNGDVIELRYVNYDAAFNLENSEGMTNAEDLGDI